MKKHRLFLITILAFVYQLQLFAADNELLISEMDNLITSGQYEAALDLGDDNLEFWEGDAEFDYLYGLAALEAGSPNEAVFALERVAATSTDGMLRELARLELARAYFVTNNLSAAENIFTQVLENNPPANVQQNIQAFLAIIDARRNSQRASINWTVSSSIGADSNINSATSNGLIDTPLIGQIELNPDGQETDDSFSNTTLSMNYNYPFTRDRSLDININAVNLNNLDTDQFDIRSLRSEIAYNWGNENNRIRHGISFSQVTLDQNGFQDSTAINSSWQHAGNNGWYQTLFASYAEIRYDTGNGGEVNSLRDVDQLLFTAGLTKLAGSFTHSLNLYQANEDPDSATGGERNGRSFTVSVR